MTQALRTALVPVAAAALSTAVLSQTLTELPSGYGGSVSMSSDATWVVGNDNNNGGSFIWSAASGPISFGDNNTFAKAVSDDGDKVLCSVHHPISGLQESAIYSVAAGIFTYMDTWVGGSSCGSLTSPYDLSNDGLVATGLGWEGCKARAYHWTGAIPMAMLSKLNPGDARGNAVSGDGQYIGGWESSTNGADPHVACIWKPDGTLIHPLVSAVDPEGWGETWGFSTDGTWACGMGPYNGDPAWIYSDATGMIELPILAGSGSGDRHTAYGISDDGKTVIGHRGGVFGNPWRAWIWTETYGMQDLGAVMQAKGLTLPAPVQTARDITPDGRTIMGAFSSPMGFVGDTFVLEFANPVTDLGGSSAGTGGVHPVLSGEGSFFPTAPFALRLDDAVGSALSVLIVSTQNIPVPLFGGILQTFPITTTQGLLTQPTGDWEIPGTWPAAMTQGLSLYFQAAVFDPAAVGQFALSNGLGATTP